MDYRNLEIDYYGDAPALRGEFKVNPTRGYLQDARPSEPDWFYKGTDVYNRNVRIFLAGLKDHYERMTSNHLLCLCRYSDGGSGVFRLQSMEAGTQQQMYSDEAMYAVGTHNEEEVLRILGARGLERMHRRGVATINRARAVLSAMSIGAS